MSDGGKDPLLLRCTYNIIKECESMISKIWVKSKIVLWQQRYYNLLTEKKDKKIHVGEVLILFENVLLPSISRYSLQAPSLDDILLGNFAMSNSIIFVEDIITWKGDFEIFSSDRTNLVILKTKTSLVSIKKFLYQCHLLCTKVLLFCI